MVSDKIFSVVSSDVLTPAQAAISEQPKVRDLDNVGSARMRDDGCPNEPSGEDDATGYSDEEEEMLSEEPESASAEHAAKEIGSRKC
jgi:hypothetical protein